MNPLDWPDVNRLLGDEPANAIVDLLRERCGLDYPTARALAFHLAWATAHSCCRSFEKLVDRPEHRKELLDVLDELGKQADVAARHLAAQGWPVTLPTQQAGFRTWRCKLAIKPRKPRTQDTKGGRRNGKHTGTQ